MEQSYARKPGDRLFRAPRLRPWQIPLPALPRPKAGAPMSAPLVYGFAGLIAIGTVLLMLPLSSETGQATSIVNALFTATSAVCVTGLVVVDTGTYWSAFGQAVILALIQLGGFGFMTSATLVLMALGRRIGLRERLLISESAGMPQLGGAVKIVKRMAIFTIFAEGAGTAVLFSRFLAGDMPGKAAWKAVFHAISGFNNAGFDLFGGFRSLIGHQEDATVLLTIAALVIVGGLGYAVLSDIIRNRRFARLSADSRVVLTATLSLLAAGTVFFLVAESSNQATLGVLSFPGKLLVAFFQSVTPRTAGFSALDTGKMLQVSLFFTMFLMLVGGASGSTAGGVKIGTFGVLVSAVASSLKGREHAQMFGRELRTLQVSWALTLAVVHVALIAIVAVALSATEGYRFDALLFETVSAFGTVGLSTGITPGLSAAGRLLIIVSMFAGRVGPLTLVSYLAHRQRPSAFRYPQEAIRIG